MDAWTDEQTDAWKLTRHSRVSPASTCSSKLQLERELNITQSNSLSG